MSKVGVLFLALVACACPNKKTGPAGTGSGVPDVPPGSDPCAALPCTCTV